MSAKREREILRILEELRRQGDEQAPKLGELEALLEASLECQLCGLEARFDLHAWRRAVDRGEHPRPIVYRCLHGHCQRFEGPPPFRHPWGQRLGAEWLAGYARVTWGAVTFTRGTPSPGLDADVSLVHDS